MCLLILLLINIKFDKFFELNYIIYFNNIIYELK
jgi:hypothetical protein